MKDFGKLHFFLSLQADFTTSGFYLTQTKYAFDLICHAKMEDAKPYHSPALSGKKMDINDGNPLPDPT